jgi:hypothetical protein
MDRRAFISGITGGFLAAPLAAGAQQAAKIPRVGVLGTSPPGANELFQAFRKGLQELGYVEGQHIHLDYRWPEGGREGYPALAAQLVQSRFDVILTMSNAPPLLPSGPPIPFRSFSAHWETIPSCLPWSRASADQEAMPRAP